MSAPAALVIAKVMVPETEESLTMGTVKLPDEKPDANTIDAAARGAGDGLRLAANVGAMLLAFIALIALANYVILASSTHETPKGCDEPDDGEAIIACTHESLMTLAAVNGIGVPDDLQQLQRSPDAKEAEGARSEAEKIEIVETLGAHVVERVPGEHPLDGTPALSDCERGRVAACGAVLSVTQSDRWTTSLEGPDLWPFITLELLLGWIFMPLALLMGVPWEDATLVGQLLGEKMVLNELLAYLHLKDIIPQLGYRSIVISTYALCGFANFGSIAIQIGGIGGIAPARIGLRAMIAGSLAAFMTATIAGAFVY